MCLNGDPKWNTLHTPKPCLKIQLMVVDDGTDALSG